MDINKRIEIYFDLNKKRNCDRRKINKLFIKFLHQNNVYLPFMYNFISTPISEQNTYHSKKCDAESYMLKAFTWSPTHQGYNFWSELNKKWKKIVFDFIDKKYKRYEQSGGN